MLKRLSELGHSSRLARASRRPRVAQLPLTLALPLVLALLPGSGCNTYTSSGNVTGPDLSTGGSGSGGDMSTGGSSSDMDTSGGSGDGGTQPYVPNGGCIGRQCQINYNCPVAKGPTTITGVVTIPAGTLPINNAIVYIPSAAVPPVLASGASCNRCDSAVPADAAASTTTDINGRFNLAYVPSGTDIPLVISVGKWRRVVNLSTVTDCTKTTLTGDQTRLPRNQSEGNIPKIALSTGRGDAMECLLGPKKLGLDKGEFTNPTEMGRVNLYAGGDPSFVGNSHQGTISYAPELGGKPFPVSPGWWDSFENLKLYDIIMLSCEKAQDPKIKSAEALLAMQTYLNKGGRVFASHYQNYWIAGNTAPMNTVATFTDVSKGQIGYVNDATPVEAQINQSFAKGTALANWLQSPAVSATTNLGKLPINAARISLLSRNTALTTDWVDLTIPTPTPDGVMSPASQYFSFNAPVGASAANQCGQMVFTDMHVTGNIGADQSRTDLPFPTGCQSDTLTPQEKALIFLLFDLSSCLNPT